MSAHLDMSIPDFVPAKRDAFIARYRQFAKTLEGDGAALWNTLNRADAFNHMASVTLMGDGPAVAGVTKLVAPILVARDEADKREGTRAGELLRKTIGAMVCTIMEANGFEKTHTKKAVPPVPLRLFTRGEVYRRAPAPKCDAPVAPSMTHPSAEFGWDKFFSDATFNQVLHLSPELSSRRAPSMYSPDRSLFYVSSLDEDVATNEPGELLPALEAVKEIYSKAFTAGRDALGRRYVAQKDIIELFGMLESFSDAPDDHPDSSSLLDSLEQDCEHSNPTTSPREGT